MREPALHVVVGAGQVGTLLAQRLVFRGHRVRIVKRGAPSSVVDGVEWARGDATDRAFVDETFRGARVVYHCANPSNFQWDGALLPLARGIREGAARAGARLVVLDSIFMYGRPRDGVMNEDHPHAPCSKKGELRMRLARELFDAHARGELRATAGYAGDFYGPTASDQSPLLGRAFLASLKSGRRTLTFGDIDQPHACTYLPDVAEGLAILGENDAALGRPWHLPTAWNGSIRELMERFASAAGRPLRLLRAPKIALRVMGMFDPKVREAIEMLYLWEHPGRLDDSRFVNTFGVHATPVDTSIAETLRAVGAARQPLTHGPGARVS